MHIPIKKILAEFGRGVDAIEALAESISALAESQDIEDESDEERINDEAVLVRMERDSLGERLDQLETDFARVCGENEQLSAEASHAIRELEQVKFELQQERKDRSEERDRIDLIMSQKDEKIDQLRDRINGGRDNGRA